MTDPELMQSLKAKAEQAKAAHAHKDESKRAFVEYHDAQREFVAAVNSPDAILRLLALVEQGPTILDRAIAAVDGLRLATFVLGSHASIQNATLDAVERALRALQPPPREDRKTNWDAHMDAVKPEIDALKTRRGPI